MAGSVGATDRYYADLKAQSPNGKYVAEAKSPSNQSGDHRVAFQRDFAITFRETTTGKRLWTWEQGSDYASPVEIIPTDEAHLVMRDSWNNYHVFDEKGFKTNVLAVVELLPEQEQKEFTRQTSAGVRWGQYRQQGFVKLDGKCYFYIRLYWGRIYVIDIAEKKLSRDHDVIRLVEDSVVSQTSELIKTFNGEYYAKDDSCGGTHLRSDLTDAVFVIKKHGLREGQTLLTEVLKRTDIYGDIDSDLRHYLDLVKEDKKP
jgi:hypothetical protein